MYIQRNNMIKMCMVIAFVILPVSSHASCSGVFGRIFKEDQPTIRDLPSPLTKKTSISTSMKSRALHRFILVVIKKGIDSMLKDTKIPQELDTLVRNRIILATIELIIENLNDFNIYTAFRPQFKKIDSLIITVTDMIKTNPLLNESHVPKSLQDTRKRIEIRQQISNFTIQLLQKSAEKLKKKINKSYDRHQLANLEAHIESIKYSMARPLSEEVLSKIHSDTIEVSNYDHVITEAEAFIEKYSSLEKLINKIKYEQLEIMNEQVRLFEGLRNNIIEYNKTPEGRKNPINSIRSYNENRGKLPQDDVSGKSLHVLKKVYQEYMSEDGTAKGFSDYLLSKDT